MSIPGSIKWMFCILGSIGMGDTNDSNRVFGVMIAVPHALNSIRTEPIYLPLFIRTCIDLVLVGLASLSCARVMQLLNPF